MNILFYVSVPSQLHKLNSSVFQTLPAEDTVEIYRTIEDFSKRLRRPKKWDSLVIAWAADTTELDALCEIKDLLVNTKVILVLPDRKNETVHCGCGFYPRVFVFADQDLSDLAAVLKKIRSSFYLYCGNTCRKETAIRQKRWVR